MKTKICSQCKEEKPIIEFHKKGIRNGKEMIRSECKICSSVYERMRNKVRGHGRTINWRKNNKNKIKVHQKLRRKVYLDKILKPNKCQMCNSVKDKRLILGHHVDYRKPFDVMWLCHVCHSKVHAASRLG